MDQILYKNLPPAKHNKDRLFQVIDRDGRIFRSDGEFWVATAATTPEGTLNGVILGRGADVGGSRTITNAGPIGLGGVTVPGGYMGKFGLLEVEGRLITNTAAHNRTFALYFGGQLMASSSLSNSGVVVTPFKFVIANRGLENVQTCHPSASGSMAATGSALNVGSVDTTKDQALELRGTVETHSMTLEYFVVRLYRDM